jgi:hypothetical protein
MVSGDLMRVGAMLPDRLVLQVASENGLPGYIGKSGTMRFAIAMLAGHSYSDALKEARGYSSKSLKDASSADVTIVSKATFEDARKALGGKASNSQVLRYALAIHAGYTEDDAKEIAFLQRGRPPKKQEAAA